MSIVKPESQPIAKGKVDTTEAMFYFLAGTSLVGKCQCKQTPKEIKIHDKRWPDQSLFDSSAKRQPNAGCDWLVGLF